MKRTLLLLLGLAAFIAAFTMLMNNSRADSVVRQESMSESRVYAYRDWQSIGIVVNESDRLDIRADGEWLYTPDEVHGPQGHATYPAPSFYPVSYGAGGALIGKVGEGGEPFVIGKRTVYVPTEGGTLYLRINDDRLGDNWGYVTVDVEVTPYEDD